MNIKALFVLVLLIPFQLFSQTQFKRGYFVDNEGVKKECLLLNTGIDNRGEDYIFKYEKKDKPRKIDVKYITEFGIEGETKFIRELIELDVSSSSIKSLKDTLENKEYEKGHAFLLELVRSTQASLFYFYFEGREFFFFKKGDPKITPLVYKRYSMNVAGSVTSTILYDNRYKEQLARIFSCSQNTASLSYTRKSLINYFESYIQENGGDFEVFKNRSKGVFNAKIVGTLNKSTFYVKDKEIQLKGMDFGSQNNYSYGVELQYILPFNRNRWGVFMEGNYLNYSATFTDHTPNVETVINYKFLEFPFGIIYNYKVSEDLQLFVKGGAVPNVLLDDSSISFYRPSNSFDLKSAANICFGAGISYRIVSAEARFYSKRNMTQHLYNRGSEYEQFSLRLAFKVF